MSAAEDRVTNPLTVEVTIDLAKHLAAYTGTDRDGEPIVGPQTLEDVIIGEAARQIAERVISGRNEWRSAVRDRVQAIRDETIRARIEPQIEEALTASLQPTNSYGVARGEPTTLTAVIEARATEILRDGVRDGSFDRKTPLVRKMIADQVDATFAKELAATIATAKAEVTAAVRAKAAQVLATTIVGMAEEQRS